MNENLIITDLGGGYKKVVAAPGYKLYNKTTQRYYSEAVVHQSTANRFTAVKVAEPTDEDPISPAEALNIITGK